jgi:outer membrane immunogenic protein
VLSYITAGWAYGSVSTTLTETVPPGLGGTTQTFSSNQTRNGFVWGSGVEASLGGNWTGKIEYLRFSLGDRADTFTLNTLAQTLTTEVREHIFRVGLNYRINGNGAAYVPPPPAHWAGFYLGGNFGGGVGRDPSAFALTGFAGTSNELFNLSPSGINGGVQAGYNWQTANWVYGVEADIQASSQRDKDACLQLCNPLIGMNPSFVNLDARLPWFGTVRGRLGYSVGPTLFYATGGLAYGSVKTKVDVLFFGTASGAEFSAVKSGWTVGAGIETPVTLLTGVLGNNWTSKSEYLYVDLGTQTDSYTFLVIGVLPVVGTNSTHVQEHIFRTGLSYHFNGPVAAKY